MSFISKDVKFKTLEISNLSTNQDKILTECIQPQIEEMESQLKYDDQTILQHSFLTNPDKCPIKPDLLNELVKLQDQNSKLFATLNLDDSAAETNYEGLDSAVIIAFQSKITEHLGQKELLPYFKQLSEFSERLVAVRVSKDQNELIKFANDIANSIWNLKPGQSYLMNGGYARVPFGHSMYYEFQKNEKGNYDIYVYNAQQGLESTQGAILNSIKGKVYPAKYYHDVQPNELLFSKDEKNIQSAVFEELLMLNLYPLWHQNDQDYSNFGNDRVEKVFGYFSEHQSPPPNHREFYVTPQRSGSCTKSSLDALERSLISEVGKDKNAKENEDYYKYTIMMTKLASLMSKYMCLVKHDENGASIKNSWNLTINHCYQLIEGSEGLCSIIAKWHGAQEKNKFITSDLMQSVLCTAKEIQNEVTALVEKEITVPAAPIATDTNKKLHQEEMARAAKAFSAVEDSVRKYIPKNTENSRLKAKQSLDIVKPIGKELLQFLKLHLDHLDKLCLSEIELSSLHYVEALVEILPIPSADENFWNELPPADVLNCMKALIEIANIHRDLALELKQEHLCRTHNTEMGLLAMTFELAKKIDTGNDNFFDKYTIDFSRYENLPLEDHYYVMNEKNEIERRNKILDFFKKQKGDNKKALFNFKNSMHIDENADVLPDFQLYKEIIDRKKVEVKDEDAYKLPDFKDLPRIMKICAHFHMDFNFDKTTSFSDKDEEELRYKATPLPRLADYDYSHLVLLKHMALSTYTLMGAGIYSQGQSSINRFAEFKVTQPFIMGNLKIELGQWSWYPFDIVYFLSVASNAVSNETSKTYEKMRAWIKATPKSESQHLVEFVSKKEIDYTFRPLKDILAPFSERGLQASSVIHNLSRSIEILKKEDVRSALMLLLTHPEKDENLESDCITPFLFRELETDQIGFLEECKHFIKEGLDSFYLNQPKQLRDIKTALFFVRFAQKLTQFYVAKHHREPPVNLLPENLNLYNWLSESELKVSDRAAIHLHLATGYMSRDPVSFTNNEWVDIYSHWSAFQTNSSILFTNTWEDKYQLAQAERWMTLLEGIVKEKFKDINNNNLICEIGKGILNLQGLNENTQKGRWSQEFPILRYEHGTDFYDIDLKTGTIKNQNGLMKSGVVEDDSSEFRRLFGNRQFEAKDFNGTKVFDDPILKHMRMLNGNLLHGLQKYVESDHSLGIVEGWHQYLTSYDIRHFIGNLPKWLLADHIHWIPYPANDKVKMLIMDKKTGKTVAIWDSQDCIRLVKGGEVELTKIDVLTVFEELDYIRTVSSVEGQRVAIELPRYLDKKGKNLKFVLNGNAWEYASNPNYTLVSPFNINGPMGRNKNYLCLQHKVNKTYKVIVPNRPIQEMIGYEHFIQMVTPLEESERKKNYDGHNEITADQNSTQSFYEYEIKNGKLISSDVDAMLYIAYLSLLSKGSGYVQALNYIKEIHIGDSISVKGVDIFNDILRSGWLAKDYSADACAIRLHAFDLLNWLKPFDDHKFFGSQQMGPDDDRDVTAVYQRYLNGLNNVNTALLLSVEQELDILETIISSHVSTSFFAVEINPIFLNRQLELQGKEYEPKSYPIPKLVKHKTKKIWKIDSLEKLDLGYKSLYYKSDVRTTLNVSGKYPEGRFLEDYHTMVEGMEEARNALAYQLNLLDSSPEDRNKTFVQLLYFAFVYPDRQNLPKFTPSFEMRKDYGNMGLSKASEQEHFDFKQKLKTLYDEWCKAQKRPSLEESEYSELKDKTPTSMTDKKIIPSSTSLYKQNGKAKLRNSGIVDLTRHNPDQIVQQFNTKYLAHAAEHNLDAQKPIQPRYDLSIDPTKDLSEEEQRHSAVINEECRVYTKELEKGWTKNQKEKQLAFKLPKKEEIINLHSDLEASIEASKSRCASLKTFVELRLNQKPEHSSLEYWNAIAQEGSKLTHSPTLLKGFRAITKEPEKGSYTDAKSHDEQRIKVCYAELQKLKPNLSIEECKELRLAIINYLREETAMQQCKRVLESVKEMVGKDLNHPEMPIYWERASKALSEERRYDPFANTQALLFESLSGLRVRKGQGRLIRKITRDFFSKPNDENFGIVIQLIMGGGKTSVILSQLLEFVSNLDKNVLFLCHHSQYGSVLGNLKEFQKSRFNKDVIPIEISKENMDTPEKLKTLLKLLKKAKALKNPIIMKTPEFQMLELEFLSVAFDVSNKTLSTREDYVKNLKSPHDRAKEKLTLLAQILTHLKTECVGVLDEVDLNLSILLGVHFPKGVKKKLLPERIALVKEIYAVLATKEIDKVVGLLKNSQADLNNKDYKKKLLPLLAAGLAKIPSMKLPVEHHEAYVRFITGEMKAATQTEAIKNNFLLGSDEIKNRDILFLKYLHSDLVDDKSDEAQVARHNIPLSRKLLKSVLNLTLGKSNNRSYGRLLEKNKSSEKLKLGEVETAPGGKVVPYMGVGTPSNTEFGYVYEAVCYHFQTCLNRDITESQVAWYANIMSEIAKKQSIIYHGFANTHQAKKFFEMTNVPLNDIQEPGNLAKATAYLNSKPESKLVIEEEIVKHTVTYHERILSSSPLSVADGVSRLIAASGTLGKASTLPKAIQAPHIIFDEGTEGRIMDTILERAHNGRTHIHKIENASVGTLLANVRDNYTNLGKVSEFRKVRAIADAGALFKPYENLEVAKEILKFYENDDSVQGVLFFYRFYNSQKEKFEESFAILKKNGEGGPSLVMLENTKKEEITKHLPLEKIFTYFDDLRTRGSDIPMGPETIIQVTFDTAMQMSNALQAFTRPRDFFIGQNGDFVILKDSSEGFIDNGNSVEGLFKTCIKNHAIEKSKQTYRFLLDQMQQYFRAAAIQIMVDSVNKGDFIALENQMRELDTFVFTLFEDDPATQYIDIEEDCDPITILKEIKENRLAIFEKQLQKCNALGRLEEVTKKVNQLLTDIEKTNKTNPTLPKDVPHAKHAVPSESNIEVSKDKQTEVNAEKETENELTKEMRTEMYSYLYAPYSPFKPENDWKINPDKKDSALLSDLMSPKIFNFSEVLKDGYEHSHNSEKDTVRQMKYESGSYVSKKPIDYDRCFPEYFQMTENFRYSALQKLPVFHESQKNANQILVIRDKDDFRILLVSEREGVFFRKWIEARQPENLWLVNPNGRLLESQGHKLPDINEQAFHAKLKEALWYVNFFNGYVSYLVKDKEMEKYTIERLAEGNEERSKLKLRFLGVKSHSISLQNELYNAHPVFHPFEKRNKQIVEDVRLEEERIRQYFFSLQPPPKKLEVEKPKPQPQPELPPVDITVPPPPKKEIILPVPVPTPVTIEPTPDPTTVVIQPTEIKPKPVTEIKLNSSELCKHRIKGILYTVAWPVLIVVNVIKNVALIIFHGFALLFSKTEENKKTFALQRRKFLVEPALYSINIVRIFNPIQYLKLKSRLHTYLTG